MKMWPMNGRMRCLAKGDAEVEVARLALELVMT